MNSIIIKRPIAIKVIMTEKFRSQIVDESKQTIKTMEDNIRNLEEQMAKQFLSLQRSDPGQAARWHQQMSIDQEHLKNLRSELTQKIDQLNNVKVGEEFPFQVMEGDVKVNVGDNLMDKMAKSEIVIKDWKVVEIRNP